MLNKACLIGHLGADPEIRSMPSGDKVASLRLATGESWKDKTTGERKERTEWHSITIFNQNLVRIVEQYTHKGSKLYVEGAIRTRKYQDRETGADRYRTEIVLENFNGMITLLDKAERSGPSPEDYGTTRTREGSERRPAPAGSGGSGGRGNYDLDDDIPF